VTKSKIFLVLSLSFISGIGTASFYYPGIIDNLFFFVLAIISLAIIAVFYKNRRAIIFGIAILFFAFGIFLTGEELDKLKKLDEDGKSFFGTVEIVKEPAISGRWQKIIAIPESQLSAVPKNNPGKGRILISVPAYPEYDYGDRLRVACTLKIPENISESFDYRMYLAKEDIFYECKNPKLEKIDGSGGSAIFSALITIKNKFNQKISTLIPAPQSGLMNGLILGGDAFLSKEYQEAFSKTGTTHIVAVSGYNVTIIAEYLMILGIFLGLWRKQAFWFAAIGIILFVIITGMAASAVRAGVMGILLIWAMKNGRLANSQNAIIFAAMVMLIVNPLLLRWDVGFQLSFLATLGIIYLYPMFENQLVKKQKAFGLTEILFLTLSAQIFVLPIILYNFGRLSIISPLANLLVLPIIPLTMLLGFGAAAIGFLSSFLGQVMAWLAYLPLRYETEVIRYLAGFRYSSVELGFPWWGAAVWYVVLFILLCRKEKRFILF
jgi:competence protein ComEC